MFGFGEAGILILLAILLFFVPGQLPKMARGLGEALREFRKAQRELHDEITREEPAKKAPEPESKPENRPIQ